VISPLLFSPTSRLIPCADRVVAAIIAKIERIDGTLSKIDKIDGTTSKIDGTTSKIDGTTSKIDGTTSATATVTHDIAESTKAQPQAVVSISGSNMSKATRDRFTQGLANLGIKDGVATVPLLTMEPLDTLKWTFGAGRDEKVSYEHVAQWCNTHFKAGEHSFDAYVTAHGKDCDRGVLLRADVYTLRTHWGAHGIDSHMTRALKLTANPDLIVDRRIEGVRMTNLSAVNMVIGIEIKLPFRTISDLKAGKEEAKRQLIAVSASIARCHPVVILTDLEPEDATPVDGELECHHHVFRLERTSTHPLVYTIMSYPANSFTHAMSIARELKPWEFSDVLRDFGRGMTPMQSDAGESEILNTSDHSDNSQDLSGHEPEL
jgi:hypothetical protein